jgi:hypothetical protein
MRPTAVVCILVLLATGAAFAEKPAIDAKSTTETFMHPSEWLARPYTEGFNVSVPPAGWTLVQTNTVETWYLDTFSPYEGAGDAMCVYDATYSGPQDEWLYYNYTMQAGDACIVFWAQASPYWAIYGYQNYDILVTINGATVWSFASDYDLTTNGTTPFVWYQYSVSLAAYSVGDPLVIGLGYVGYDGAQAAFDALSIGDCPPPPPVPCAPFPTTCVAVDYNLGDNGFVVKPCGGAPVWQWGIPTGIPTVACDGVPVTHVLATVLNGNYPVSAGESVIVGSFDITPVCYCLELCHYYSFETNYDGGNVKVSTDNGVTWTLVYPFGGYDGINTSTYYPCMCIPNEEMFTGTSTTFVRDSFNLTEYIGQTVLVKLDMGSDSSVTYPGWYIKWIKLGGEEQSPVQSSTWGAIKAMYR